VTIILDDNSLIHKTNTPKSIFALGEGRRDAALSRGCDIIYVFRTYSYLVVDINGGNDMCWFFTFANRPIRAMKGTL
jgi:hypothetical protein